MIRISDDKCQILWINVWILNLELYIIEDILYFIWMNLFLIFEIASLAKIADVDLGERDDNWKGNLLLRRGYHTHYLKKIKEYTNT